MKLCPRCICQHWIRSSFRSCVVVVPYARCTLKAGATHLTHGSCESRVSTQAGSMIALLRPRCSQDVLQTTSPWSSSPARLSIFPQIILLQAFFWDKLQSISDSGGTFFWSKPIWSQLINLMKCKNPMRLSPQALLVFDLVALEGS